jgi:hypothetical protein
MPRPFDLAILIPWNSTHDKLLQHCFQNLKAENNVTSISSRLNMVNPHNGIL